MMAVHRADSAGWPRRRTSSTRRRAATAAGLAGLAGLRPLPKVPVMSEISPVYSAELDAVFRGRKTARDAATDVDRQVQARLGTP